jgi:DNA-binding transcriptional regulator YiaG
MRGLTAQRWTRLKAIGRLRPKAKPLSPADLRAARKVLGLTQKGLAEALRMGEWGWQTVAKWEADSNARGVPGPVQVAVECMLEQKRGETRK